MNKNELDMIYQSFTEDIYRYLLYLCGDSYIAEDIMQDTFFRAYLHFEECPSSGIKPWLFKVAYNSYIDFKRKNSRSQLEDRDYFEKVSDDKTVEDEILIKERIKEVKKLIEILPEKQRQAIILCDFNGLSYKEAAIIIEVTLPHFKVLLFRARQAIRNKLEGDDSFE